MRDKVFRRCLRHEEYALIFRFMTSSQSFSLNSRALRGESIRLIHQDIDMTKFSYRAIEQSRNAINLSQIGGQA
ncbi:hypothetical protein ACVXHB_18820 [Escherichia coli]